MLDTIALTLVQGEFAISDPGRFSPSAQGLLAPPYYPLGSRGYFHCLQNSTRAQIERGEYVPRLTLAKRMVRGGFALSLRVEFSAPKLIFGNNFDELKSNDFDRVLESLMRAMREMGVLVEESVLRGARVSAVHYSKNIVLSDYVTCGMVLADLARVDLSQRLDLAQTDYRNAGHAIRYHTNSFDLIFYDKIKDLQKSRVSEKRAMENDNWVQARLFSAPESVPKPLEVLRIEIRLGNRRKIRDVLKRIDAAVEPTFAALFDASVASEILLHYWTAIREQAGRGIRPRAHTPEDVLIGLIAGSKDARPAKLLQKLGLALLVGSVGPRGAKSLLVGRCQPRTWQRLKREISALTALEDVAYSPLGEVDEALAKYIPLRLKDFEMPDNRGTLNRRCPPMKPVARGSAKSPAEVHQ